MVDASASIPDADDTLVDASPDAAAPGADAGPPLITNDWGPPSLVSELSSSTYSDLKPTFRGDMLEAYLYRPGVGAAYVFWSTRPSTAQPWSDPIKAVGNIGAVEISSNGLELYNVSSGPQISSRTRSSTIAAWGTPVGLYDGKSPSITGDGRYLYYAKEDGGFVVRSRFTPSGAFGAEQAVVLPGAPDYAAISISRDHLVVMLAGNNQVGDPFNVEYVRSNVQSAWQGPFEVSELTSRGGGNCSLVSGWEMYCSIVNPSNGTADVYKLSRN